MMHTRTLLIPLSSRLASILAACAVILAPWLAAASDDAPLNLPSSPEERIARMFADAGLGPSARMGVYVADARTGRVVIDLQGDSAFIPASMLKLLTAAAALDVLGPQRRFATTLETAGDVRDGVLSGTLVLRGGGDPSFGPRFQKDRTATTQVLEDFADDLKSAGIRRIPGDILVDDSLFSGPRTAMGWPRRERAEWYCAEVGALCFNDNTIDVTFRGKGKPGAKAEVTLSPATAYVTFLNGVRVSDRKGDEIGVRFFRSDPGSELAARGGVPRGESRTEYAAVRDPAMFTGAVLAEVLIRQGIKFEGKVKRPARQASPAGAELRELAIHHSPPLAEILPVVLGISQNLYAEVLMRHVAIARGREPSFAGGGEALMEWARSAGLPAQGLNVVDGSGLSRLNRATPRFLVALLRAQAASPTGRLFAESLAAPGEAGSLRNRFDVAERVELRGRLRAKTGFIDNTHGLAGYLKGGRGGEYVFAICLNDVEAPPEDGRRFVEKLLMLMARSDFMP